MSYMMYKRVAFSMLVELKCVATMFMKLSEQCLEKPVFIIFPCTVMPLLCHDQV